MNTPASSSTASSGSDVASSPGPDTPKREYKFHAVVRNTYGRAKPAEQMSSSPDPWSSQLSFSPSSSTYTSPVHQRRSRLSGSFGELASSSEAWMTPTRGTRNLIDKLNRAKLDLESGSDDSDEDKEDSQELDNVFKVRKGTTTTTPSRKRPQENDEEEGVNGEKMSDDDDENGTDSVEARQQTTPLRQRKRQLLDLDSSSPVRRSPRSVQGQDKLELQGNKDVLTPRSSSPSPPASPTRRSTRTSVVFPSLLTPAGSASTTTTLNSNIKGDTKKLGQQATISSFFATKAGTGTGILKGKTGSVSNQKPTGRNAMSTTTADAGDKDQQVTKRTASGPSTLHETPRKLEQLFLAFSKDRTKSSAASTTSASKQRPVTPVRRPNQLQREDDKLKRYHCPQCGMPYVRGQPEDEQIHDRYHRAVLGGIDYPGYKNEVVIARFRDQEVESTVASTGRSGGTAKGDSVSTSSSSSSLWGEASSSRIVMVSMSDTGRTSSVSANGSNFEKKKVKEVLEVVNKELGSVEFDPEQLDSCKVFLYISGKKKVVGCVIAERIKEGFEIMTLTTGSGSGEVLLESKSNSATSTSTTLSSDSSSSGNTPMETNSQVQQLDQDRGGAAIFCSKVPQPAICGISRIWVSSQHRRQKIASRMLDAVRERFIYACKLETKDLAFSQPTGDGKALARRYLGTDRFLVYVE
ncbi:N-acetyltransferase esco2 [Linnemannia schmuckeri]|uniref:N-acetyltransferase esco2 n=1 Tax=Linnemannia schmuckeri TaxID=64567 RepID=A0A9P5S2S4_9FUNG|nr:N-acetyltransferase esco2 [Linnemannia schmuckeri]